MKAQKLSEGSVFSIPIDEDRCAVGVVRCAAPPEYFIVVFDTVIPNPGAEGVPLAGLSKSTRVLAGLTLDALFYHKRWKVLGVIPKSELESIPEPLFLVDWNGKPTVESVSAEPVPNNEINASHARPVSRKTRAPIGYQLAIQAFHGLRRWEDSFETMRYEHYYDT